MEPSQPVKALDREKLFLRVVLVIAAPFAIFLGAVWLGLAHPIWWALGVAVILLVMQRAQSARNRAR